MLTNFGKYLHASWVKNLQTSFKVLSDEEVGIVFSCMMFPYSLAMAQINLVPPASIPPKRFSTFYLKTKLVLVLASTLKKYTTIGIRSTQ